jgi:hypothetical protein
MLKHTAYLRRQMRKRLLACEQLRPFLHLGQQSTTGHSWITRHGKAALSAPGSS